MNLIILTPDKELFQGKITSVSVPAIGGRIQILKDHAPIVAALGQGEVRYELSKGEKRSFKIERGILEVLRNEVSLLVAGVVE